MEELIFQYQEINLKNQHLVKAVRNGRDGVFVLVRNHQNQWVLGRKKVYPEGLARVLGGKIEPGENPLEAAVRELAEESGVTVDQDRMVPLVHAEVFGQHAGKELTISLFLFYANISQPLEAASDVDSLVYMSDSEAREFMRKMGDISPEKVIPDDAPVRWSDWGAMWTPIHQAAFDRVKELGL